MMKKLLLSLVFTICLVALGFAQNVAIQGKVVDSDKVSIIGASVTVVGTQLGTLTDIDGNFHLSVPKDATLEVSYIGMETQSILVMNKTYFEIELQQAVETIENVVVVAYGTTTREGMTGSVTNVDTDRIGDTPVESVDKMLAGKMAGVTITAATGQPGAASQIRIRGTSSLNASSEPLWVVDGIPVSSGDESTYNNSSNALSTMNPNDIESITVLKDAAAASIYGSRAANGVILVTTKSGKSGKTQFTARAKFGVSVLANDNNYGMMDGDQLLDFYRTAAVNAGSDPDDPNAAYYFPKSTLDNGYIDWFDHMTRMGTMQEYEVNAAGGNDKGKFFASVNYHDTEGSFYGFDFSKITARVNADYKLTKTLSIGTRSNLAYTMSHNVLTQALYFVNPVWSGMTILPWTQPYNEDGTHSLDIPENSHTNPRATAAYSDRHEGQYKAQTTMFLQWVPIEGLTLKTNNSFDGTFGLGQSYTDPRASYGAEYATLYMGSTRRTTLTTSNTAQYSNIFGDLHSFRALVGQEAMRKDYLRHYTYSPNLNPDIPYPTTGTSSTDAVYYNENAETLLSYLGMVDYNYDSKYYLQASMRYDGSSLFAPGNQWGMFWSVGGSWNIHNEKFMASSSHWLNELKFRASYGVNGNNQISPYQSYGVYKSTQYAGTSAVLPSTAANEDLSWEKNYTFNVGFDFALFGFLTGSIDAYTRDTRDMLLEKDIPQTSGFSTKLMNIGSLNNKGLEFSLNANIYDTKDFSWSVGGNIALNRSKVLDLGGLDEISDTSYTNGTYIKYIKGESLYTFTLKDYYGVNPTNGAALWRTADGALTEDYSKAAIIDAGSPEADFNGGFNTSIRYKNLTLSAFFEYKYGNEIIMVENYYVNSDGQQIAMNHTTGSLNYWQEPGDTGCNPKPIAGNSTNSNARDSTRWLEDGSYLRVKDITLSYSLPRSVAKSLKMGGAKIYVSATNLYTFHDANYWDPERGTMGMGSGIYPQTKTIIGGIDLTF